MDPGRSQRRQDIMMLQVMSKFIHITQRDIIPKIYENYFFGPKDHISFKIKFNNFFRLETI